MLEDALGPGLSTTDYPFVAPPEGSAAGSARPKGKAGGGGAGEVAAVSGRRVIVFMLGGMSYSELRSVHEVERAFGREIIAGSTSMITPQTFLLALKKMKQLEPVALI